MDKENLIQEIKMQQRGYLRVFILGVLLVIAVVTGIIFVGLKIQDYSYVPIIGREVFLSQINKNEASRSELEKYAASTEKEIKLKKISLALLESNRNLFSIESGAWDGAVLFIIAGGAAGILGISAAGMLFTKRLERLIKEELVL